MSYFPTFNPYYEDSESVLPEDDENFYYWIDGIYCARCNENLGYYEHEAAEHYCAECYYCGEHNSCNCDEINKKYKTDYCTKCAQPGLDCSCKEVL